MDLKLYQYVGPAGIRDAVLASCKGGKLIRSNEGLSQWIDSQSSDREADGSLIVTFTIGVDGILALAPRRSEHVACARGGPVLSAGEMTFVSASEVSEISNQSTGYCPEPESWKFVALSLDRVSVSHPGCFTTRVVFRLCAHCHERNIVKDDWFVCALCGADLPSCWNFPTSKAEY